MPSFLARAHQLGLHEVRVVLDLQGGRRDAGRAQQLVDRLALEVGDAEAAGEALVDEGLHGRPGLADGGLGQDHLGVGVVREPAGRVAHGRVDVGLAHGEVHHVEVKVVEAPVLELAPRNRLDTLGSWNVFHSFDTMKRSDRLTSPSLIARATPWPHSTSLP